MKPRSEHVKPLERYDILSFAAWLRRGFEDLNHGEEERKLNAFAPLNYFVGYEGDINRELKNIYELLSATGKENFRNGIATALSKLPPEDSSVAIFRGLLHLAGRLHATEIFTEIVKEVGNGFFGIPDRDQGRRLFALSLDIVAGMAKAKGAAEIVRRLVGSSFFRAGYAPRAFIALCRAEPEYFPDHLALLRDYFTILHKQKTGIRFVHFTAKRFVHYVDLHIIANNLARLLLTVEPGGNVVASDNWLGEALFIGEKGPLIIDNQEGSFVISRRDRRETEGSTWFEVYLDWSQKHWRSAEPLRIFLDRCIECNGVSTIWRDVDLSRLDEKLQKSARQQHAKAVSANSLISSVRSCLLIPKRAQTLLGEPV